MKINFIPSTQLKSIDDGKTHINVYSKGKTGLGRLLSNFAHTPIEVDEIEFQSVESWWYWKKMTNLNLISNNKLFTDNQLEIIKDKIGLDAKLYYRSLHKDIFSEHIPTEEELLEVYRIKLEAHPPIKEALIKNKLPLAHYYVHENSIVHTDTEWTAYLWIELLEEMNKQMEE